MSTVALLPGDGIGAEVLEGPVALLRRLEREGAPVRLTGPWPYGTTGWMQTGSILPAETVAACRDADVILSGAVGTHPGVTAEECPNPEASLIELRHIFDLRVSVRTVCVPGAQDVTIVRNITGGAYAGPDRHTESDGTGPAEDLLVLEPARVQEVFDIAVGYARQRADGRMISVDKASVFATSRLWRRIAHATATASGIPFADVNVDRAAYELVARADLLAWCPDLTGLGLHTAVRRGLDAVLAGAASTYDLAPPGAETIGLDEFNTRVLDAMTLEAHR